MQLARSVPRRASFMQLKHVASGLLAFVHDKSSGVRLNLSQTFRYYTANGGSAKVSGTSFDCTYGRPLRHRAHAADDAAPAGVVRPAPDVEVRPRPLLPLARRARPRRRRRPRASAPLFHIESKLAVVVEDALDGNLTLPSECRRCCHHPSCLHGGMMRWFRM